MYCVGIIHHIWNKKGTVKQYSNGTTSNLTLLSEVFTSIDTLEEPDIEDEICDTIDEAEFERRLEKAHQIIEDAKNSPDPSLRFRARVFYYSRTKYKNPRQFSIHSNIPYRVCFTAYNAFKEELIKKCA